MGDFTLTKRHLGVMLLAAGAVLVIGTLGIEIVRSGPARFGTLQTLGLALGVLSGVIGLSLLPLGAQPA